MISAHFAKDPQEESIIYNKTDPANNVPHPFALFPRRKDHMTSLWVTKKAERDIQSYEKYHPWAIGDFEQTKSHFGVINPGKGNHATCTLPEISNGQPNRDLLTGTGPTGNKHTINNNNFLMNQWKVNTLKMNYRNLLRKDLLKPIEINKDSKKILKNFHYKKQKPNYIMIHEDVFKEQYKLAKMLKEEKKNLWL